MFLQSGVFHCRYVQVILDIGAQTRGTTPHKCPTIGCKGIRGRSSPMPNPQRSSEETLDSQQIVAVFICQFVGQTDIALVM